MAFLKSDRVVIKFGGADLSTGEKIRKAAEMVLKSGFKEIIVVVSAMGNTTDNLIDIMSHLGKISDKDYADILSMGERTSARIFCSALRALGADAVYIEPSHEEWPIITDSNFRDAKPDMQETFIRVQKYIEPLLSSGKIVVICGFLGRDKNGNVTTLGRGGSDTTALVLANCLRAGEVLLVKETEGVLSADPKIVNKPRILDKIDIYEMFELAHGGAKIVKAEALKYKIPGQRLRVVGFMSGDLRSPGTEIMGVLNSGSFEIREERNIAAISLICDINPRNLSQLFELLGENTLLGVSTGRRSITVFVVTKDLKGLMSNLHSLGFVKALSCLTNVGLIEISHPDFIDSPGWVAKITGALASRGINIVEVTTSKSTINIFIDESKMNEALVAVRGALEA
ncbi:MAG: aspartate kinase [Candidatus Bathyarchaeia archaeon]|nr:aspartate kinase [Candidatus Bathyarchaeota archaeon]